ncbi:MAG TPA: queuosine precursor transporter [Gammaproteobacteria bacterium]|nr:queuosine precursor transporter [Gammaproteobacteria bacterium]
MQSRAPKIIPYKYIILLAMLFITIDLAAVCMAYKMVSINKLFEINSGATFIFPITYALGDIITEVYGYNMARKLIWLSLFLQFVFALLVTIAIHLPSPLFWNENNAYFTVFGSIFRFILAGTAANIVSNFMNVYLVSKLKIPMEGKLFWLRSILSTMVSGFLLVAIIVVVGFSGEEINLIKSWIMFKSTYACEISYAFILVVPAALTATFLKRSENVDVYDYNTNFNPFFFK